MRPSATARAHTRFASGAGPLAALALLAAALTLAGCPRGGGTQVSDPGDDTGRTDDPRRKPPQGKGGDAASDSTAAGSLPPDGIPCAKRSCVYHAGVNAYFTCLSGGAGTCFHFGTTCEPTAACMFDPTTRSYRACSDISEGRCLTYGSPCEPPNRCTYNPADDRHHTCEDFRDGQCHRYGPLCTP